ncbi:hypothetical protein QQP08_004955 [Theobroma cacao]|nr:hypothetical protein QQP08_004955 [Theobroma cacao]
MYCYISNNVLSNLLSKLKCLRVLSLERYQLTELPDVFGDLIHLRYLNFSYTPIETLPDSICKLYNLETLILQECSRLKEFPSKMRDLINLRHLDFTGANSQIRMPMGIGELTSLQTLTRFVVSRDNGLQIQEMEKLSNLKGGLLISGLENIVKAQDAAVAGLCNKSNLSDLTLEWKYSCDAFAVEEIQFHMDVLNSLRPHAMLERLTIKYYGGETFPSWIGDPSIEKLLSSIMEKNGLISSYWNFQIVLSRFYIYGFNDLHIEIGKVKSDMLLFVGTLGGCMICETMLTDLHIEIGKVKSDMLLFVGTLGGCMICETMLTDLHIEIGKVKSDMFLFAGTLGCCMICETMLTGERRPFFSTDLEIEGRQRSYLETLTQYLMNERGREKTILQLTWKMRRHKEATWKLSLDT